MESVTGGSALENMRWQKEDHKKADDNDRGMLTQEDFFALLTKELSHQDPTKPVDPDELATAVKKWLKRDELS